MTQRYYDKHKRNKQSKQFYNSVAWKRCRELALKRDNYLCQDCLSRKRITQAEMVHHIVEVTDDFTKALEVSNLRSLCNSCHNKHHDRRVKKKNKVSNLVDVVEVKQNTEMW